MIQLNDQDAQRGDPHLLVIYKYKCCNVSIYSIAGHSDFTFTSIKQVLNLVMWFILHQMPPKCISLNM